ncbi:hypothetical protein ACFRKE_22970 [Kitasatospora indigofera]|uniref:hypothetical protein n=1 Tax=Kitasatospora indigofera TaxID=67307 RepID=UPI0036880C7A
MPSARPSLLYVSDPAYPANGRSYGDEDIRLTARLREYFDLALCHPLDARALMGRFDAVVIRNSGPVLHYQQEYEDFRRAALAAGVRVYNPLTGRGDMAGKQYLLDLGVAGHPVIPTADGDLGAAAALAALPAAGRYVVKPRLGADSLGLRVLDAAALATEPLAGCLVQPYIALRHEVSFYYVDREFQYALYAPDPARRWELEPWAATPEDLAFAARFIEWNTLPFGIQRVDACRTEDGGLLLVELEDLNPYLSLDLVDADTREAFAQAFRRSVEGLLRAG